MHRAGNISLDSHDFHLVILRRGASRLQKGLTCIYRKVTHFPATLLESLNEKAIFSTIARAIANHRHGPREVRCNLRGLAAYDVPSAYQVGESSVCRQFAPSPHRQREPVEKFLR